MVTELGQTELRETRAQAHSNCAVCSPTNSRSLCLKFAASDDGGVQARFNCDKAFEGYTGMLHGGVIASLLDGAMTNCMFAHCTPATTAELNVRFRHPAVISRLAPLPGNAPSLPGRSSCCERSIATGLNVPTNKAHCEPPSPAESEPPIVPSLPGEEACFIVS